MARGFGAIGNFFSGVTRRRARATETVGGPGFALFGGVVDENERETSLRGDERYKTFSDILVNCSTAGASVRYFLNLISRAGWNLEPADEGQAAKDQADFMDSVLHGMNTPYFRIVRRTAGFRMHGFSVQEWTAKRRDEDSLWGLLDIEPRPQATIEGWDVDENGNVIGMIQRTPQALNACYLPREKTIYAVDDSLSDSPIGLGIYRHLAEPWNRLKMFQMLEGYAFEGNLRGVPILRAPIAELKRLVNKKKMTLDEFNKQTKALRNFSKNHAKKPRTGLFLDSEVYRDTGESEAPSSVKKWGLELVQGSGDGLADIANAIQRVNFEISMLLGTEGLMIGNQKTGTQALSKDKSHNFALIIDSTLKEIAAQYQKDIIETVAELNGMDPRMNPKLVPEAVQFRDVEQIFAAIRDLYTGTGLSIMPGDPIEDALRDLLQMPPAPERDGELELDAMLRAAGIDPTTGNPIVLAPGPGDPAPGPAPEPPPAPGE
jgi:hypothetical protein